MSTPDLGPNTSPAAGRPAPLTAGRIGVSDVERIEEATRAFRALDYRYGGGACRDAVVGRAGEALALRGRCREPLARVDLAVALPWATFFTETDMSAIVGTVYSELALAVDPSYTRLAIPAVSAALNGYGPDMTRSQSFNLIFLATNHLLDGDIDRAATVGAQAVAVAESVKTVRTKDRLRPLKREADKRWRNADARALSERIATFTATRPGCCWTSSALPPQRCTPSCGSLCQRVWRPQTPSVPAA